MQVELREKIIDYEKNKKNIEKWINVKGEMKYNRFAEMLEEKHIDVTWNNVSHLYRYDKRLLINNFKYFSFLEEYCRAVVIQSSIDSQKKYEEIKNFTFHKLIQELSKLDKSLNDEIFHCQDTESKLYNLKRLRNQIAHNGIVLELDNLEKIIDDVHELLPFDYKDGYKSDIYDCRKELNIPDCFAVIVSD